MVALEQPDLVLLDVLMPSGPDGYEVCLRIREFSQVPVIMLTARDNEIDEICIGVKRRSKVGKMVFGSNAQYIILNAPCPVVTVK